MKLWFLTKMFTKTLKEINYIDNDIVKFKIWEQLTWDISDSYVLDQFSIWNILLQKIKNPSGEWFAFIDISNNSLIDLTLDSKNILDISEVTELNGYKIHLIKLDNGETKFINLNWNIANLNVKWTKDKITNVFFIGWAETHIINLGWHNYQKVQINDSKWVFVNPITLEPFKQNWVYVTNIRLLPCDRFNLELEDCQVFNNIRLENFLADEWWN